MCGIAGYLSPDLGPALAPPGSGGTVSGAALQAVRLMCQAQAHRGPDAEGLWSAGSIALGHRRLSIIDLRPEANQPLFNEDRSIALVANGEIYNFAALRELLEARGHRFRSRSDCEVILHLYEEEGEALLQRLRGMFAFALWDSRRQRLLLARDRAGEKPLNYAFTDQGLYFASELAALAPALPTAPPLDLAALDQYLTLQYVPAPLTIYQGVRKLPAAHYLIAEPGQPPRVERYWHLSFVPTRRTPTQAEAVEEVRALLDDAVQSRLIADVPVGAFLSGGVDSSTVVALLQRRLSGRVKTFSIDFPAGDGGEGAYARLVAGRYGTEHHELVLRPDAAELLPRLVPRYGEPFADPSALATYYVAKLAREHVTVALSGDGGDEAFAGYTRYGIQEAARRVASLPGPLPALFHGLLARLPGSTLRPAREFAAHGGLSEPERYLFLLAHFTRRDKERLVGPALLEFTRRDLVVRDFERFLARSDARDPINRLLDLDVQTYLPDDIFTKVDIASMAHALEVRAPLVDHLLLERLAQLPGSMKMRHFRGKQLLRRAVADIVPAVILRRRKKGFGLPLGRWLREDLAALSRDILSDRTAAQRGLFVPAEVQRLLDEHRSGIDHGERLWNLTVLELWLRSQQR